MRNPESTRNTSTPMNPAVAYVLPAWNSITAITANARIPSSDG